MAERLGEGPFARNAGVHRALRHRARTGNRVGPRALDRGPCVPQRGRITGRSQLTSGELAVQLGVHERRDVDAVDHQARITLEQPRRVQLHAGDLAAADDHLAEVATDEAGRSQRPVDEGPMVQRFGDGLCHATSLASAADTASVRTGVHTG